ncbi:hypothetical protein ACIOD2_40530 [Amycolatopsis sp. NPDC088138]|uniref:hypothetical protein n=1 Tax=Amycolatopsis sp. NPDC088138 TaxID=3363938 RepID=UPI00382453F4
MPTADLRVFSCTSGYNAAGEHVLDKAEIVERRDMPIEVPQLLQVNALAAPLRRRLAYRVKQYELNLVLSFLTIPRAGRVAARTTDLRATARHISAFVTESVGMGMLTATMRDFHHWKGDHDHLEHFDALPSDIAGAYRQQRGVRPDLLFRDPAALDSGMAGEARGRTTRPPKSPQPLVAQRRRLDEILGWSARQAYHPVTMAWTCLGGPGVGVDLFDITFPPPSHRRPAPPDPSPPKRPVPEEQPARPAHPTDRSDTTEAVERERREYQSLPRDSDSDGPYVFEAERALSVNAFTAIEHLYQTAPRGDETQIFNDEPVRGDWVSADLIGQSNIQLFLGVLADEPPPTLQSALRARRRRFEAAYDEIQVDVFGRLIVAVSLDSRFAPPWREIATRLGQG